MYLIKGNIKKSLFSAFPLKHLHFLEENVIFDILVKFHVDIDDTSKIMTFIRFHFRHPYRGPDPSLAIQTEEHSLFHEPNVRTLSLHVVVIRVRETEWVPDGRRSLGERERTFTDP